MEDKNKSAGVDSTSAGGGSAIKLLDKAMEFDWTLKISGAFIFADSAMVVAYRRNFLNWDWSLSSSVSHIGFAITAFLTYCLFVSIIIPVLNAILQRIVWAYPQILMWLFGSAGYNQPYGCITIHELEDLADREQSSYLQAKVQSARAQRSETVASIRDSGRLAFTTLVFLVVNYFVDSAGAHTAVGAFLAGLTANQRLWLGLAIIVVLLTPIIYSWIYDEGLHWVHYRPLYEELEAKRETSKI